MSENYDIEENYLFNQTEEKLNPAVKITFISLETIISMISIFINSIIIFAFIKEPKLRQKVNLYIISLVTVDFLSGLLIIPFGIIRASLTKLKLKSKNSYLILIKFLAYIWCTYWYFMVHFKFGLTIEL